MTEDRATKGTAGTGVGSAVLGLIAGIAAVSGWLPVLMGVTAVVLGLISLVTAGMAWKRAKDQTGEQAGTPGTNLSISGVAAGVAAVVLGIVGVTPTGEVSDPDEGSTSSSRRLTSSARRSIRVADGHRYPDDDHRPAVHHAPRGGALHVTDSDRRRCSTPSLAMPMERAASVTDRPSPAGRSTS